MAPPEPKLDEAAAAFVAANAKFVVIGGFAVIANRFVRATEDVDFLVPDDPSNDRRVLAALRELDGVRMRDEAPLADEYLVDQAHLRALTRAGIIAVMRGGLPPLDFDTVAGEAMNAAYDGLEFQIASLRSIVGFKRLAGRPRDPNDLIGLKEIHGSCPTTISLASKIELRVSLTASQLSLWRYRLRAVDFALTDEQKDFVDAIRDFCDRECGTQDQRERLTDGYKEHHNFDLYKQMADLGWLGVTIDEQYGGSGGTMLDACLFMEETTRGLAPIGGYATTLIVAGATQRFGTEVQKEEILGGIASGSVEAIAMTEPEAGSDVGSLTTKAERVDGGFVINGQKVFISNAHIADHVLVVCRTTRGESKHEGLTMIWVPRDVEGMEIVPIQTMGGRETNTLYFTDCVAPESAVLGEVDKGWTQLMAGLNVERLILAATMLGIAQRAFDDALAYAKERKQFGRTIGSFQALQHRFADLATDLEAARLMTRWVATLVDEDPDRMLPKEASMVKLFVTEVAKRTTLEGMQMMGGYGYSSEYDMERLVRSSLVSTIYGGTSEIQRTIIAKTLGL